MSLNSDTIRTYLRRHEVDGLLITHLPTIRWAVGFESSNALLYVGGDHRVLATDGRYRTAARELEAQGTAVVVARPGEPLEQAIGQAVTATRLGFQAEYLTVAEQMSLNAALPATTLIPSTELFRYEIAQKSPAEVTATEQAQRITDVVFTELLGVIKPGVTEKQLAADIVSRQLQHGADGISPEFWPVVASGPNSARPHAHPTERKVAKHDVVLLDFGCTVSGYCSDMTRTVVIGSPPPQFHQVYDTVLKAQIEAIAQIKAGLPANQIDATARQVIEAAGYTMPHSLGHGVGLEIHEWPVLGPRNSEPLPDRAIVTVEPGVYLPGEFGVRIEDMVLLGPDGCRNLTASPKELLIL